MLQPTLQEEKKLWKKGYKYVAGLDEAGRGPLAGPVAAGAVIIRNPKFEILNSKQNQNFKFQNLKRVSNFVLRASNLKLRDSKKLTPRAREMFYNILTTHPDIWWGIGIVSEKVIDKINILEATKLAMVKAIENLQAKYGCLGGPDIDYLILDGKMDIDLPIPQKSIVKADEKVLCCAAASILAKVTRDRIMMRYHKEYPQYGFDKHKGYPTKYHYAMLKEHGPCQIHRKSFTLYK